MDKREYYKAYRLANAEKIAAYRKANSERTREYDKVYRKANSEKIAEYQKAYREANRERIRGHQKTFRAANKERVRENNKAYRAANMDVINNHNAKRRATKLNQTPHDANPEAIKFIYWQCARLNANLKEGQTSYHVDHIWPLSKGGIHHQNNLIVLRADYNLSKHASVDPEWVATCLKLKDLPPDTILHM